jgi:ferredoxin
MKAIVDRDACTGCELCEGICPVVFEMDDEGIAVVRTAVVPPEAEEDCREAADSCPVDAIIIED